MGRVYSGALEDVDVGFLAVVAESAQLRFKPAAYSGRTRTQQKLLAEGQNKPVGRRRIPTGAAQDYPISSELPAAPVSRLIRPTF